MVGVYPICQGDTKMFYQVEIEGLFNVKQVVSAKSYKEAEKKALTKFNALHQNGYTVQGITVQSDIQITEQ